MKARIYRDIDALKIWGNDNGMRFLRDPDDKTKYKVYFTDEDIDKLESFVRQQQAEINQQQDEKKALYNLVAEQDKKIIDLAFKLAYAERGNEVVKEAKYGITTKWNGITTYHETTEPIGKAQE